VSIAPAIVALGLSRICFVETRYTSIGRGNGAPGFMSYWSVCYGLGFLLSIECISLLSPLIRVMTIDLMLIMLSAAVFKSLNGYLSDSGIEYGLVNPVWSYWYRKWLTLPSNSRIFQFLNVLSVLSEILIALFLLFPKTWFLSSWILIVTFILLMITVRLGSLPITMIIVGLSIFYSKKIVLENQISHNDLLNYLSGAYILLLVMNYTWVWSYNRKKQLPFLIGRIAKISHRIAGAIIWSVFTAGLTTNYFELNHSVKKRGRLVDFHFGDINTPDSGVHSGITLTTLSTYRDYFPNNLKHWDERCSFYLQANPKISSLVFYKINKIGNSWIINSYISIKSDGENITKKFYSKEL
jgi:hypothetical protein